MTYYTALVLVERKNAFTNRINKVKEKYVVEAKYDSEVEAKVLSHFENGGGVWNTTMKDGSVVNVAGNVISVLSITRTTIEGVIV